MNAIRDLLTKDARNPRVEAVLAIDNRAQDVPRDAECSLFAIRTSPYRRR